MDELPDVTEQTEAPQDEDRRYKAPALEKGLDILELLAAVDEAVTLTGIVTRLGRSHGELFRMVQVLEYRGYLEQDPVSDGYRLTDRLFSLGIQQPRMRNLIEVALPIMRQVSLDCGQSCHLALHSQGEMVVVARMESSEQLGFSVRVGYRKPLMQSASGLVLYAFQPEDVQERWEALLAPKPKAKELAAFRGLASEVRQKKLGITASRFVAGVIDISAPVLRGGAAAAALTMPYLETLQPRVSKDHAALVMCAAADQISEQLIEGDSRA